MFDLPIAIGLSPNTFFDDYILAFKLLFQPWKWKEGEEIEKVEKWFTDYFRIEQGVAFNAGRSALLAILTSLEIGQGDEVLVQAFICVAVPNSVLWSGAKPVFVDIDKTFNVDVHDAEKKLSSKTKAIIVQHTFGIPADLEKITDFCKKHNIYLIEDCAHSLGTTYKGKLIGAFGDAAFFSFGRDKIISSVFGGMAIISSKLKVQSSKLRQYQQSLVYPSYYWIGQQLLHPIVSALVLPLYNVFNLGKLILFLAQRLKLLSVPVYTEEKLGLKLKTFPRRFPNALAILALQQLEKLERFNTRRKEIAKLYFEELKNKKLKLPEKQSGAVYLRFNILTEKADELRFIAKKRGIILGNWYHSVIDPDGVSMEQIGYKEGSCPKAEAVARMSLNLPTYPRLTNEQVEKICIILCQTL